MNSVFFEIGAGRFLIKTLGTEKERREAFALRYQVFQVELLGHTGTQGEDSDEFDEISDHLGIFDSKTHQMVATCRLNCSRFSNHFYSAQEFDCQSLLARPEIKLELGRVCVHRDFRKGVIVMLLWRALAEYMLKTESEILFGCGSVMTEDPAAAVLLYRYLNEQGKVRADLNINPAEKYRSVTFEDLLLNNPMTALTAEQQQQASALLPPLCRSYFDIGCYVPGPPAFDRDFKCIDFLTVLEANQMNPKLRQKMMGL